MSSPSSLYNYSADQHISFTGRNPKPRGPSKMIKLTSRKLFKTSSKSGRCPAAAGGGATSRQEIDWELRPGGMLVQKREEQSAGVGDRQGMIIVRVVVNGSRRHDLTVSSTTTFGELKVLAGVETGLEPREQRILFRGKEKEDGDHLHMAGVKEGDKVLLLEDPAIKERKLRGIGIAMQALGIEETSRAAAIEV